MSADDAAIAGREFVRQALAAFEDVEERVSHGEAAWFIRGGRQVAMFADRHHDDRVGAWMAAAPGMQEALVGRDPGRYFRPPYLGHRGWVGVYLDVPFEADEVAGLLAVAVDVARSGSARRR